MRIARGVSVFDPPKDLIDASGVAPKLGDGEQVLWIGTPGRLSSFFCANSVVTPVMFFAILLVLHRIHEVNTGQFAYHRPLWNLWAVVGFLAIFAFIPQLLASYISSAFVYVLTTRRMFVRVDRTRLYFRWLSSLDADGFAIYDLKYLNGARGYVGLLGYGNISVRATVASYGELRDGYTFRTEPFFFRERRYVKVFYHKLVRLHLAETILNVYFGLRDVGRLGDILNDQCAARSEKRDRRETTGWDGGNV